MRDLAFYNAGNHEVRGPKRALIPLRRILRRVLRPIFQQQVNLYEDIYQRLDREEHERKHAVHDLKHNLHQLTQQTQATVAFGWDYVAMVRRLAALEDQVQALTAQLESAKADDEERRPIRFPRLEAIGGEADDARVEPGRDEQARARVC